jgi:hypothetical protein
MGKMSIPGENVPVDRERARWFISLIEELLSSLSDSVAAEERQRIERVLSQLRMAWLEGA